MPKLWMNDVSQIYDNLYLSSCEPTYDSKLLTELNIKRILTLDVSPLDKKQNDIIYLFIRAMDHPKEDLLSKFEECHRFISEGVLKGENVLVHCVAGVSRSATIVISFIMVEHNMSAEEALNFVAKQRPIIDPNKGFVQQLKIFEKMNRILDPMNGEYRRFLVEHLRYKMLICRPWGGSTYRTTCPPLDNYFQKLRDLKDDNNGNHRREDTYKCKKCRFYLFNEINVIKRSDSTQPTVCESIYVEPLQWMVEHIGQQENGAINCTNCMSKLGHFDWHRIDCQCDRHKSLDCLILKIESKKVDSPFIQMSANN